MKLNLFISIIFTLILFGCNSGNKNIAEIEIKSKIKNEYLKEIIPSLIQLQNSTFNSEEKISITILTTKEFIYLNLNSIDSTPSFTEKIGDDTIAFVIMSGSYNPERYFDFEIEKIDSRIANYGRGCGIQPFLAAKFKRMDDDLKLEKISTFYDNSHFETFYYKSDSAFLNETGIVIFEPEPKPIYSEETHL